MAAIVSPSISTSAFHARSAVTTVPFLMTLVMSLPSAASAAPYEQIAGPFARPDRRLY